MSWDLDTPNLPFKKPKALENLEVKGFDQREAMDPNEASDHIQLVADTLAKAYKTHIKDGDFEGCFAVVKAALNETGFAFGGRFGAGMVAKSEKAAEEATKIVFPEPSEL